MDKNDFDDMLKGELYRDILFRMVIWFGVPLSSILVAIKLDGSTAITVLAQVSKSLTPLINVLGSCALILCGVALMLKDLEETSSNPKFAAATKGMLGGFVRRAAGDLSLWALGVTSTMICAVVLAAIYEPSLKGASLAAVFSLVSLLVVMFVSLAISNIWVRRSGPSPVVTQLSFGQLGIVMTWAGIVVVTTVVLARSFL